MCRPEQRQCLAVTVKDSRKNLSLPFASTLRAASKHGKRNNAFFFMAGLFMTRTLTEAADILADSCARSKKDENCRAVCYRSEKDSFLCVGTLYFLRTTQQLSQSPWHWRVQMPYRWWNCWAERRNTAASVSAFCRTFMLSGATGCASNEIFRILPE